MFSILCLTFYLAQKQVGHGENIACDDGDIGFLIRSGGAYPSYMLSKFAIDVLLKEYYAASFQNQAPLTACKNWANETALLIDALEPHNTP